MTLGHITPAMRLWCRRLHHGAIWYRTKEYSYTTFCDKYRTPAYHIVEQMRDCGLITFIQTGAREGHYWEARLTPLGQEIGRRPPNYKMRRQMKASGEMT